MEKHLYGISKSTFKLPGLSNKVQMEMEWGLYFANISVTVFHRQSGIHYILHNHDIPSGDIGIQPYHLTDGTG